MAIIYTNIQKEVTLVNAYEGYGLEIVSGKEKTILNRNNESYYLDLVSFSHAIHIDISRLLDLISYDASIKGYLAYYRDNQYRVIKVIEMDGFNDLVRNLRGLGYNIQLLKTTREQVYKILEQIKHKEEQEHGKNQK